MTLNQEYSNARRLARDKINRVSKLTGLSREEVASLAGFNLGANVRDLTDTEKRFWISQYETIRQRDYIPLALSGEKLSTGERLLQTEHENFYNMYNEYISREESHVFEYNPTLYKSREEMEYSLVSLYNFNYYELQQSYINDYEHLIIDMIELSNFSEELTFRAYEMIDRLREMDPVEFLEMFRGDLLPIKVGQIYSSDQLAEFLESLEFEISLLGDDGANVINSS